MLRRGRTHPTGHGPAGATRTLSDAEAHSSEHDARAARAAMTRTACSGRGGRWCGRGRSRTGRAALGAQRAAAVWIDGVLGRRVHDRHPAASGAIDSTPVTDFWAHQMKQRALYDDARRLLVLTTSCLHVNSSHDHHVYSSHVAGHAQPRCPRDGSKLLSSAARTRHKAMGRLWSSRPSPQM